MGPLNSYCVGAKSTIPPVIDPIIRDQTKHELNIIEVI